MERQADGWTLCQFIFSAFYPVVHPPLYDHPFSESHAMQVHKPFILSPPIHLKEEPEMSAGQLSVRTSSENLYGPLFFRNFGYGFGCTRRPPDPTVLSPRAQTGTCVLDRRKRNGDRNG